MYSCLYLLDFLPKNNLIFLLFIQSSAYNGNQHSCQSVNSLKKWKLSKFKKKLKQINILKEIYVGSATVCRWLKDEIKLQNFLQAVNKTVRLKGKIRDEEIHKALFLWFKEQTI